MPCLLSIEKEQLKTKEIKVLKRGDDFICQFLNSGNNCCRIYKQRPFECKLYPFLLVRRQKTLALAAHLACPYLNDKLDSPQFKKHIDYLKTSIGSEKFLEIIKNEVKTFRSYPELEVLIIEKEILKK